MLYSSCRFCRWSPHRIPPVQPAHNTRTPPSCPLLQAAPQRRLQATPCWRSRTTARHLDASAARTRNVCPPQARLSPQVPVTDLGVAAAAASRGRGKGPAAPAPLRRHRHRHRRFLTFRRCSRRRGWSGPSRLLRPPGGRHVSGAAAAATGGSLSAAAAPGGGGDWEQRAGPPPSFRVVAL